MLATFAQLRGELAALSRRSINLDTMELRVRHATAQVEDGTQVDDDPKSEAGIPEEVGYRLHEFRHTGSTWSAQSGATLKELMARIGIRAVELEPAFVVKSAEEDCLRVRRIDDVGLRVRGTHSWSWS